MFPWARLQCDGANPSEVLTTYQHYFRPLKDHQPRLMSRSEAERETWPVFFQHVYNTTDSTYTSAVGSQHASGSPFPAFLHSFGSSCPSEAAGGVGCTCREASLQEASVAVGWQESNDGFQYQEGVILLSPYGNTVRCDTFLTVLGKGAEPQLLLGPPVVSGPFITPCQNRDAENWQNHESGWSPADLQSSTCSPGGWTPECPGCFETPAVPPHSGLSSTGPPVCGRRYCCTSLSRKQPLTEYQEKFAVQLAQSQVPVYFPSCYRNLHPSV